MVMWMKTESFFLEKVYRLPESKWSLKKRMLIITILYIALALIEHCFFLASEISQLAVEIRTCNLTDTDYVELFVTKHLKFIFDRLPFQYNHFWGFVFEYLNFSYTFYWNFIDLFIILISLGASLLYEKVYFRVKNLKGLLVDDFTWSEIRLHYVQVSELIKIVNRNINEIIIVASFSDGYFTLSQAINITT